MKKFTIKIADKDRPKLISMRAALAKASASGCKKTGAHEAMEKQVAALEGQIRKLERSADLTDAVANSIAVKREKLRLLNERLQSAANPGGKEADELTRELRQFRTLFQAAMSQVQRQLEQQILTALAPFYTPLHLSPALCADTDIMHDFGNFTSRQWGLVDNPFQQAKDAIKIIDALLDGQSPWQPRT